ncbi:hypothetical protein [Rhodospira trueperi]|uniref:Uncharacterized protein n=1 Tax=Rhodospira trueperi TaxID=69960 RepID=A0A1G7BFE8_9PROT|nr:hypothetical protein [Rhodospira trueperi]SDE25460.1 hypothetical protein SAMN05421720_1051 [Rhodospira trueperi]
MNPDETEALRQEYLADMGKDLDPKGVQPGSYGCHEALHMASFLMEAVDGHLMEHPAVTLNPEWFALAAQAHDALFALYQAIGAAHLHAQD